MTSSRDGGWFDRRAIALHAAVVVLAALIVLALSHDPRFLKAQLNAHTLWQTSLIWDVLHRPDAWKTFQFSTNPNIFPDAMLGLGLQSLLGSWRWALVASMLVRFLGLGYIGGWLARSIGGAPLPVAALYVEGIYGAVVLLSSALPTAWDEGRLLYPAIFPVATMFVAATHSGAYIPALGILGMIVWSANEPVQLWRTVAVYVLSALTVMSDRELWVEFVIPAVIVCAAAFAFGLARRDARRFAGVAVLGAAVVAGAFTAQWFLQPVFNHAPDLPTPGISQLLSNAPRFCDDALGFVRANPNLTGGVIALAVVFLAFPFVSIRRLPAREVARAWLLWGFAALSIAGALAFTIALYQDFDAYRYLEPALFVLVPIAAALFMRWARARIVLPALVVIVFFAALLQTGRAGTLLPGTVTWQPDLAPCLEGLRSRYDLHAGLAGFWTARPLTIASDEMLQVDQVSSDGSLRYYTNDAAWFGKSFADPARPPEYRFIVLRELDDKQLAAKFGPPAHVEPCGNTSIWIYDDPSHLSRVLSGSH